MRTWCDDVIDLLEELEVPVETVTSLSEDLEHASAVAGELARAFFPSAQFEDGELTFSPFNVGSLVGHKLAFVQQLGSTVALSSFVKGDHPSLVAFREALQEWEQDRDWKKEVFDLVSSCLRISLDQSPAETFEFFCGFNAALEVGSLSEAGGLVGAGSTTMISFILMIHGKDLSSHFKSVTEFHEWLVKNLGVNVAGDLGRTQQICSRWKVRFKKRGRPRKCDKSGKSPS